MPTKYKDYPIYSYNEPATYSDFTGGINTDPSNEHLSDNEMRDCVNMTYLSGALVKRKGAKEICRITCDEDIRNIQGVFLFTYKITYIIVAADGKLYQSPFNENTTLKLTRLNIYKPKNYTNKVYDETSVFDGLEVYQKSDIIPDKHDGFIMDYIREELTGNEIQLNKRSDWESITSGMIEKGDFFEVREGLYQIKYVCISSFEKTLITPEDINYWEVYSPTENDTPIDWSANIYTQWVEGVVIKYSGIYYRCTQSHYNRKNSLYDKNLFVKASSFNTNYSFFSLMFFQNYRKIEAATFNNKLYVMTGTRIVTVEVLENKLTATVLKPYLCNSSEITNIGYNYISPYPELAIASQTDTVTTGLTQLLVKKLLYGKYLLEPIFNVQLGDDIKNYWFRWEKFVNDKWYTIIPFRIQDTNYQYSLNLSSTDDYSKIEVDDADSALYRVTFAISFETPNIIVKDWELTENYNFKDGDLVKYKDVIYKCITSHNSSQAPYPDNTFVTVATLEGTQQILWEPYLEYETLNYLSYDADNNPVYSTVQDYKIDKIDGEYFGQATSVIWKDLSISDTFKVIHSCTKILVDGNKLLYYSDNYNTGKWYKTILNNPNYVTDRGALSFKTTKNEALIKVLAFQGNIICFANADNVGGSIHIVTGNGDDYDDKTGYYSPYQRRTINSTVSSDNPDTIQVCDNILIFKYFKKLYYINASDLSNDVIKVNQCNKRLLSVNQEVDIPWDDNSCVSEVTNDYYALLWREKFSIDNNNNLVQERPAIRVKMYFNMANQLEDKSYNMPWLRDESKYFNVSHIIYFKGKSLLLYNNLLLSFNEDTYEDLGEEVTCTIRLKGEELNYAKIYKILSGILVYYHRNQHSKIDFNLTARNEAGHVLYNSKNKLFSIGDLRILKEGDKVSSERIRLDSTIQDTKLFTVVNKFPCLLVETSITVENKGRFSLSSITYYYETIDSPDSNPYDYYTNIIRPEEVE
jgi:hypothetical protein